MTLSEGWSMIDLIIIGFSGVIILSFIPILYYAFKSENTLTDEGVTTINRSNHEK
jgi:hypothetical protein